MTVRGYTLTFAVLLVLTGVSFGTSFLPFGALEIPIALGIAAVKAGLVALIFMHLLGSRFGYRLTLLVAVVFVGIMVSLTTLDPLTR
jgi:cytochrome c oxidase subunit 4